MKLKFMVQLLPDISLVEVGEEDFAALAVETQVGRKDSEWQTTYFPFESGTGHFLLLEQKRPDKAAEKKPSADTARPNSDQALSDLEKVKLIDMVMTAFSNRGNAGQGALGPFTVAEAEFVHDLLAEAGITCEVNHDTPKG